MKKLLFVIAFVGTTVFSGIQAGNTPVSNFEEVVVKEDFCKVVKSYKEKLTINSDGSTTRTQTLTTTFYPC